MQNVLLSRCDPSSVRTDDQSFRQGTNFTLARHVRPVILTTMEAVRVCPPHVDVYYLNKSTTHLIITDVNEPVDDQIRRNVWEMRGKS